ncbi:MAG: hypothetical protein WA645_17890 [Pseudolabrys sp.]|jgi:hypothetical protein
MPLEIDAPVSRLLRVRHVQRQTARDQYGYRQDSRALHAYPIDARSRRTFRAPKFSALPQN